MTAHAGKVGIVTGSSRGIGRAIAIELAAYGARIIVNYKEHDKEAAAVVEQINTLGGIGEAVRADVSIIEQVEALTARALARFGSIDILVNNAGITLDNTLLKMPSNSWHEVLRTDLDPVYYCCRLVIPHMVQREYGRIVNIASVVGQIGGFGQTNYAAAKSGVIGFTKSLSLSLSLELARYGITVNAVCPGFVDTDMLRQVPTEIQEQIRSRIPLKRFGQPEEVARVVRFLVAEGDYITGQCINVNGGLYM